MGGGGRCRPTRAAVLALAVVIGGPEPAASAEPRRYVVDPGQSQLRFHAVSRFVNAAGRFGRFEGEIQLDAAAPDRAAGRIVVQVASLDTGIGRRDEHLRSDDFFATARHPHATFVVEAVRAEDGRWLVSGPLTIRGVTRPLSVPVTVTAGDGRVRVIGEFVVRRREFGVAYDSFFNPIRDEVRVWFDLAAVPG
ncbi:MAG TPA: YceI family protein [Methylomirabilota bacterium]|nr:YceI family protein [Methylomirabilota bacterium]